MKRSGGLGSIGELGGIVEEIVVSIETPEENYLVLVRGKSKVKSGQRLPPSQLHLLPVLLLQVEHPYVTQNRRRVSLPALPSAYQQQRLRQGHHAMPRTLGWLLAAKGHLLEYKLPRNRIETQLEKVIEEERISLGGPFSPKDEDSISQYGLSHFEAG